MSKRLRLARRLLSKKGVIFISIDDNEQAQLKLLCDEIFRDNFVGEIIWQKKYSPQSDAQYFSDMHDFILVYVKQKNRHKQKYGWERNLLPRTEAANSRYRNYDDDPRGLWKMGDVSAKTYSAKTDYPITTPSGRIVNPPNGTCWRFSKKKFEELVKDNRIWFGKSGNNVPAVKKFLNEVQDGIVPTTWWTRHFAGDNQDAKQELNKFALNMYFSTPKPVKLLKRILQIASKKDSQILDFFAGSGTTGQAVMELNKEDDGNRKFILCTNNENKICTDVCYPRIKKVIEGYSFTGNHKEVLFEKKLSYAIIKSGCRFSEEIEEIKSTNKDRYDKFSIEIEHRTIQLIGIRKIQGTKEGLGGNLRYFKTAFVDAETTHAGKKRISRECTEMLCLKESCFKKYKSQRHYSIFTDGVKHFCVIYDYDGIRPFIEFMQKFQKRMTVYQFTLDDDPIPDDYEEILEFVTLKPIPAPILGIYREVNLYGRA